MTLKKSLIAFMPSSPNQRASNEPDTSATRKHPKFMDSLPHLGDEEYAPYAQIQMSPGPMAPNALVAHQAPHTPGPPGHHFQHCPLDPTSQSPGLSNNKGEWWCNLPRGITAYRFYRWIGTAARADYDRSTLGWNELSNIQSESPLGAGHISSHLGGDVEAQRASTGSPM
jgi:hypothetical protein